MLENQKDPFNVLAFDCGNVESGVCIMSTDYKLLWFGKFNNTELMYDILPKQMSAFKPKRVIHEQIASYGMPVGESVFSTCIWIGKFSQYLADAYGLYDKDAGLLEHEIDYVKRKQYITELCGSSKAKDKNVKAYLVERFAPDTPNYGKGSKKNPGFFYGVSADAWSAIGIAVWYIDNLNKNIAHV